MMVGPRLPMRSESVTPHAGGGDPLLKVWLSRPVRRVHRHAAASINAPKHPSDGKFLDKP